MDWAHGPNGIHWPKWTNRHNRFGRNDWANGTCRPSNQYRGDGPDRANWIDGAYGPNGIHGPKWINRHNRLARRYWTNRCIRNDWANRSCRPRNQYRGNGSDRKNWIDWANRTCRHSQQYRGNRPCGNDRAYGTCRHRHQYRSNRSDRNDRAYGFSGLVGNYGAHG